MELALKRYHFTVDDFNKMAEQGLFAPTDRLELIEGEIFEISPIGKLHARAVNFLSNLLVQIFAGKLVISTQNPVILDDLSEPQPDIAVLRLKADFYKESHPYANDVLLVIEVADTTVEYDRTIKFPKYAKAGIQEVWLVNLDAERIEVHSNPKEQTYGMVKIYQRGEQVLSESFAEVKIQVDDILG
jgi:Uma2 family endonuclease